MAADDPLAAWERSVALDDLQRALAAGGATMQSAADILAHDDQPIPHVWGEVLPVAGMSIWGSGPGVGKSTLARGLAMAVVNGTPFLDFETRRGPVVLLHLEEHPGEVRRHVKLLGLQPGDPIHILDVPIQEHAFEILRQAMLIVRPALVVVDPMQKFLEIREINDYASAYGALGPLLELARSTGAHVMLLHHTNKAELSLLGSQALKGGVDSTFIMRKLDQGIRILECDKIRYGIPFEPIALGFNAETKSVVKSGTAEEALDEALCRRIADLIRAEDRPLSKGELQQALGVEPPRLWRALSSSRGGEIRRVGGRVRALYTVDGVDAPMSSGGGSPRLEDIAPATGEWQARL